MRPSIATLIVLALVFGPAGSENARADWYRWIDGDGVAHYTTEPGRIPRGADAAPVAAGVAPEPSEPVEPLPEPAAVLPPIGYEPAASQPATSDPAASSPASPSTSSAALPGLEMPATQESSPQIETLEAAIERDREELRRLIGSQSWEGPQLANDPRLRELAERLPRMQAQLEELRRSQ